MKACFVILILAQALMPFVLCSIPKERYAEIHNICVGKTGIDVAVVDRARKGDFENSPSLKQYILCIWQEEGCIADGKINEQQTVDAIPPAFLSEFEKPVRECVKEHESEGNLEEATFKATACVQSKTLDRFFLP